MTIFYFVVLIGVGRWLHVSCQNHRFKHLNLQCIYHFLQHCKKIPLEKFTLLISENTMLLKSCWALINGSY